MVYGGDPQDNPYAAPEGGMAPLSSVGPSKSFPGYAGFWLRFVAHLIDSIVVTVVFGVVVVAFGLVVG